MSATRRPLVLLPGMMCDARLFANQVAALADVAEVWVGDLTRSGSVAGLARDVLGDAPFDGFALGGLSMGGIVAMEVVRQAPQRVGRLALLDTNHRAETPDRRAARERQIARVLAGGLREVLAEEMKPLYLGPDHRGRRDLLDLILAMGLDLGPAVFQRQSAALRDRPDATVVLAAYAGPALVLCGRHDLLCPVERHTEMADLLPDARLDIVERAGHLPTIEEPSAVSSALRCWLARSAAPHVRRGSPYGN